MLKYTPPSPSAEPARMHIIWFMLILIGETNIVLII